MSWGLKWQVPFVSLAGHECVVKIYADGYSGDATTLIGGAEPFVIEEDDSKSLLDLVRYTSGYLSVIEKEYGDLDGLFPTTDFEHMVTLEVNGSVQFKGFMQATEYDNDWDRGPRELHFPVMSPLGLMDHREFSDTYVQPIRQVAICELLAYALNTMNCGYTDVYVPATTLNIDQTVSTLAVNGFNSNFSISGQHEDIFEHESFDYLIKGICGAFGWMVHDVPGALVFVKWNWDGGYYRLPLSTLQYFTHTDAGISGDDVLDFGDYFAVSGADHRQSYLRPLKEISLSIDGETAQNAQINFERMKFEGYSRPNYATAVAADEDYIAGWLSALSEDVGGTYVLTTNALDSDGVVQNKGVNVADCGDRDSHSKRILIKYDSTWETNWQDPIFYVNVFNPPSGVVEVKFHLQWCPLDQISGSVGSLANPSRSNYPRMVAKLYRDGNLVQRTLTDDGRWPLIFDKEGYFSLYFTSQMPLSFCHKLTIEFYAINETHDGYSSNIWDGSLYAFNSIAVNTLEGVLAEYTDNRTRNDKLTGNADSPSGGTVSLPLSFYRENSHMVGYELKSPAQVQAYNYMFQAKRTLTVTAKVVNAPGLLVYGQVVTLEGVDYRLVATKYEPRDDNWRLLLVELTTAGPHQ